MNLIKLTISKMNRGSKRRVQERKCKLILLITFLIILLFSCIKCFAEDVFTTYSLQTVKEIYQDMGLQVDDFNSKEYLKYPLNVCNKKDFENDIIQRALNNNKCNHKESYIWNLQQIKYPYPLVFDSFFETKTRIMYYDSNKKNIKIISNNNTDLVIHKYYYKYNDKKFLLHEEILGGKNNEIIKDIIKDSFMS